MSPVGGLLESAQVAARWMFKTVLLLMGDQGQVMGNGGVPSPVREWYVKGDERAFF